LFFVHSFKKKKKIRKTVKKNNKNSKKKIKKKIGLCSAPKKIIKKNFICYATLFLLLTKKKEKSTQ